MAPKYVSLSVFLIDGLSFARLDRKQLTAKREHEERDKERLGWSKKEGRRETGRKREEANSLNWSVYSYS